MSLGTPIQGTYGPSVAPNPPENPRTKIRGFKVDTGPMKICQICSGINEVYIKWRAYSGPTALLPTYDHQPSFDALVISAARNCQLCSLFLEGVVGKTGRETGLSVDEVHAYFRKHASDIKHACYIEPSGFYLSSLVFWVVVGPRPPGWSLHERRGEKFVIRNLPGPGGYFEESELSLLPNFEIARSWIERCKNTHKQCISGVAGDSARGSNYDLQRENIDALDEPSINDLRLQEPQLPTRVIDVGQGDDVNKLFLITSGKRKAQYVTLSHCWGAKLSLRTVKANLKEHEAGFPLSSLPQTFQDAVITTRNLGYRYLWIDSLCIIQDSNEDWQRECSKMASIYRNSTVTIAGSAAADSHAGFLHERNSSLPPSFIWEYRQESGGSVFLATIRQALNDADTGELFSRPEVSDSPLDRRGWILQEQLLSSRLLYFGADCMYWECNTDCKWENFPRLIDDTGRGGHHQRISKKDVVPFRLISNNGSQKWDMWYLLVEEYTRRLLTQPMDKLPALSGIASWLCSGDSGMYLAGLLKPDLRNAIAWRVCNRNSPPVRVGFLDRGPSWSWVSTDYQVQYFAMASRIEEEQRQQGLIISKDDDPKPRLAMINRLSRGKSLGIHKTQVKVSGVDSFGQIHSASLKVRGIMRTGLVHKPPYYDELGRYFQLSFTDDQTVNPKTKFWPDLLELWLNSDWIESPTMERKVDCLCIDVGKSGWYGLAVEKILPKSDSESSTKGSENAEPKYIPYRRIGAVLHGFVGMESWFEDAAWEMIELF